MKASYPLVLNSEKQQKCSSKGFVVLTMVWCETARYFTVETSALCYSHQNKESRRGACYTPCTKSVFPSVSSVPCLWASCSKWSISGLGLLCFWLGRCKTESAAPAVIRVKLIRWPAVPHPSRGIEGPPNEECFSKSKAVLKVAHLPSVFLIQHKWGECSLIN